MVNLFQYKTDNMNIIGKYLRTSELENYMNKIELGMLP
jgi:hypothetical protein